MEDKIKVKGEGDLEVEDKRKDEGNLKVKRKVKHKDKGNNINPKFHLVGLVYCMLSNFV